MQLTCSVTDNLIDQYKIFLFFKQLFLVSSLCQIFSKESGNKISLEWYFEFRVYEWSILNIYSKAPNN